jgi:hypothetical protein
MKKKLILPLLIISIVGALGFCSIFGSDFANKRKAPHIRLNTTLSNSLSNITELEGMDKEIRRYLAKWDMYGASVAIMRNDSLIYAKGYGWADKSVNDTMNVGHILRVASVSKLITSIGIMKLQDEGKLSIKDKVFGETGILKNTTLDSLAKDTSYRHLTIEHLLRHQGGFYRDPLFSSKDVKLQMKLNHPPTADDFFANRDARLTMCIRPKYYIKGEENTPFNYALSGYSWNKFMDDSKADKPEPTWAREKNITDAPCIRYAEVLLNYAEAAYELHLLTGATFTQADLDRSINLIRARADVNLPALQIVGDQPAINGVTFDDPKRMQIEQNADGGITPALLWEIRRERRVELCLEGFRLNDLKRWCKLDYLWNGCNPDIRYGAYIRLSDFPKRGAEVVLEDPNATEGYILRNTLGERERPIKRNYINPIPSGQITLYKTKGYTLSQNTEWGW